MGRARVAVAFQVTGFPLTVVVCLMSLRSVRFEWVCALRKRKFPAIGGPSPHPPTDTLSAPPEGL